MVTTLSLVNLKAPRWALIIFSFGLDFCVCSTRTSCGFGAVCCQIRLLRFVDCVVWKKVDVLVILVKIVEVCNTASYLNLNGIINCLVAKISVRSQQTTYVFSLFLSMKQNPY